MPLYEYQCATCQHKFELLRSFSSADEGISCPSCHNGARRQLSVFASFSKGSDGQVSRVAGSGYGCGSSCASSSCGSCGL